MVAARCQRGLTLLEMLLVLALLVIIGALVAPAMGRFMQTQQLRDSANLIRGEWARARVQAMKSGRIHVFRYEQNGSHYTVDFWMADDDMLEAGDDSAPVRDFAEPESVDGDIPSDADSLPDGVRFLLGKTEYDARSQEIESDLDSAGTSAAGIGWSAPILFYSDGTTSSAEVVLVNNRDDSIRISLRGLTGIGAVSDVFASEGSLARESQ
jgi:prepilin-type N-terminal cleavage/methylation domain-containing protein